MDRQLIKKVTTLSFLGAAGLAYLVVNTLFKVLGGAFGPVQKLYSIALLNHGLPVAAAMITFGILQFNPRLRTWAEEVILEVSKVVWPSRSDTISMTIVVCVFVGFSSVMLIVIDYASRELIHMIIQ